MFRFHPDIRIAGLAMALAGIVATAAAAPASATTGTAHAGSTGSRASTALNLLEAQGYGDFANFRQAGRMYDATITRDGKTMHLSVNPDTGQIRKRDS